jgi:hypothetical protein
MVEARRNAHTERVKGIDLSLVMCALAPLFLAGCAHNKTPDDKPPVTTPNGPCRDDENFDDGHCVTRFPGDFPVPR